MKFLRQPLFPYTTPQERADRREARAVKVYLSKRQTLRELDRAVQQAERIAETVARLERDARYLR